MEPLQDPVPESSNHPFSSILQIPSPAEFAGVDFEHSGAASQRTLAPPHEPEIPTLPWLADAATEISPGEHAKMQERVSSVLTVHA